MIKFTNEEKDFLLVNDGKYTKIEGYAMDYEPPESNRVIITVDEIKKCIGKPIEVYYWDEDSEWCEDLESSWEGYYDNVWGIIDAENEEQVDEYLTKILKERKESNNDD